MTTTVRNIADHAVDDPDGAALLPGQTAGWDDDYAAEMIAAGLVVDTGQETSSVPVAEPDSGSGKAADPAPGKSSGSSGSPSSSPSSSGSGGAPASGSSTGSGGSTSSSSSGSSSGSTSSTATGGSQ